MTSLSALAAWGLGGLALTAGLLLFRRPLSRLTGLLARTALGAAALALFSHVGPLIGVQLGVNLFNALVLGLLGVPGFALLLMLQWVFRLP